jgi:hypothetical protein
MICLSGRGAWRNDDDTGEIGSLSTQKRLRACSQTGETRAGEAGYHVTLLH